jgi:hypothetical protein
MHSDNRPTLTPPRVPLDYANGQDLTDAPQIETQDERLFRLRSAYSSAFNDVMDACLGELLLADDKAAVCLDAAQFFSYLMAVKIVEVRGQETTRENLMAAYWPMQKALKDDVPNMLRALADRAAAAARGELETD